MSTSVIPARHDLSGPHAMPWFGVVSDELPDVLLVGNPNSGKTTLFNALSGSKARAGNYPGITVDQETATLALPSGSAARLIDLPGIYSLTARSPDEKIAVDAVIPMEGVTPRLVIVVVDATVLERNLYLPLQILETSLPTLIVLNMMDEVRKEGTILDVNLLETKLGARVIPCAAAKGEGVQDLLEAIDEILGEAQRAPDIAFWPEPLESELIEVEHVLEELYPRSHRPERRARALWALLSLGEDELTDIPTDLRTVVRQVQDKADHEGRDLDMEIIGARYHRVEQIAQSIRLKATTPKKSLSALLDRWLTRPLTGIPLFILIMVIVFESLFSGSEPIVRIIEAAIGLAQRAVAQALPAGPFENLLVNGVIAGVGNVIVFVPQIAILFACIGFLEDSGYLARVAYLVDRLMKGVGLSGKAFVPLLSGFACAVPAVMATRTIENRRDRLVTMLALPLMSCSARLPVYTLIIATVFGGHTRFFGILSTGSLIMFGMYVLSITSSLTAASILRRTVLRGKAPTLVLELPQYRMPQINNLAHTTWRRIRSFLTDAGTIILSITIILWALLSYPKDKTLHNHYENLRSQVSADISTPDRTRALEKLDTEEAAAQLEHSIAGTVGHAIEPALKPLGFDWKIGVGIIGSFAAREVLISTLGIVYGIGKNDEQSQTLRTTLREAKHPSGKNVFTPLAGFSLMVFYVLACQCMSTLAVVRRESGSWKWPVFMFTYMTCLAYIASLLIYQIGSALRIGIT